MMKFGLTLGGGGAKGSAHIGIIRELERMELQPDVITGTSVGGLMGAFMAMKIPSDEIIELFQGLNLAQLYALPTGEPAISHNTKIERLLRRIFSNATFSDLDIDLAVVTVDLFSRKVVILDEGDLVSALMATMAFPVLLPPVERNGMLLVDGGLLNNVPFDVARARGATFVVAVDLTNTDAFAVAGKTDVERASIFRRLLSSMNNNRNSIWQIISTVSDINSTSMLNVRMSVSQPDVLLRPNLNTITLLDFPRIQEGIEAGEKVLRDNQHLLEPLLKNKNAEPEPKTKATQKEEKSNIIQIGKAIGKNFLT